MRIKDIIYKEASNIKTDIFPSELASIALFKILKSSYFENQYDFIQLNKTDQGLIGISTGALNSIENLSNSEIHSMSVNFENNGENIIGINENAKSFSKILTRNQLDLFERFINILKESKDLFEIKDKVDEELIKNRRFIYELNKISDYNSSISPNNILTILMIVSNHEIDKEYEFDNKIEYKNISMYNNKDSFNLGYELSKLIGNNVKDLINFDSKDTYKMIIEKNIDDLLGKGFIQKDLEKKYSNLTNSEDKIEFIKDIKKNKKIYETSILKALLESNNFTDKLLKVLNKSYLSFQVEKYLDDNEYKVEKNTIEDLYQKYNKEIELIEAAVYKEFPTLKNNNKNYEIEFKIVKNDKNNSYSSFGDSTSHEVSIEDTPLKDSNEIDKTEFIKAVHNSEKVDLMSHFDYTFAIKNLRGLNHDWMNNNYSNPVSLIKNDLEVLGYTESCIDKRTESGMVQLTVSPVYVVSKEKNNMELIKDAFRPFFQYAKENNMIIEYESSILKNQSKYTSLRAFIELKKEYNSVISTIKYELYNKEGFPKDIQENYELIENKYYYKVAFNEIIRKSIEQEIKYDDIKLSLDRFKNYIKNNNISIEKIGHSEINELIDKSDTFKPVVSINNKNRISL